MHDTKIKNICTKFSCGSSLASKNKILSHFQAIKTPLLADSFHLSPVAVYKLFFMHFLQYYVAHVLWNVKKCREQWTLWGGGECMAKHTWMHDMENGENLLIGKLIRSCADYTWLVMPQETMRQKSIYISWDNLRESDRGKKWGFPNNEPGFIGRDCKCNRKFNFSCSGINLKFELVMSRIRSKTENRSLKLFQQFARSCNQRIYCSNFDNPPKFSAMPTKHSHPSPSF